MGNSAYLGRPPVTVDDISSLHRLYLACDAERDQAVKDLDDALVALTVSEEKRRRLSEQVFLLVEQVQGLELRLAAAEGR